MSAFSRSAAFYFAIGRNSSGSLAILVAIRRASFDAPTVAGSGGVFLARPAFDAFHRTEALKAYWFVSLIL